MSLARELFRLLYVVPVARLMLRVMAWRLVLAPMRPFQVSRNEALASSAKLVGRCAACGATGALEADHHRPFWAGGLDTPPTSTPSASPAIGSRRRQRRGCGPPCAASATASGHGRLRADAIPTHRWALAGLLVLGLVNGAFGVLPLAWRIGIGVMLGIGVRWEIRRRFRLADLADTVGRVQRHRAQRYRPSLRLDHARAQSLPAARGLRARAVLIWLPCAYLGGFAVTWLAL